MKEERRRSLDQVTRRLKTCETALDTARINFAKELRSAVEDDGVSLGEASKTLAQLGRPITRQRVHQIISSLKEV